MPLATSAPAPFRSAASPPGAALAQPASSPGGPAIYALSASPAVAHAGDVVVWDVRTSSDVTRVTASVPAFTMTLERRGPGHFGTSFQIPRDVPGIFFGDYAVAIVAFGERGATARSILKVRFK